MVNFEDRNQPVAEGSEMGKEFDRLLLWREFGSGEFWFCAASRTELNFANNSRRGIKYRLAVTNNQVLNSAETEVLHHRDQPLSRMSETGFGLRTRGSR